MFEQTPAVKRVYPACAGIHLSMLEWHGSPTSLPRMRGDPPHWHSLRFGFRRSTPHARGSTEIQGMVFMAKQVYPACAGIHLCRGQVAGDGGRLPRMRGDPPIGEVVEALNLESTPHARGSTFPLKVTWES